MQTLEGLVLCPSCDAPDVIAEELGKPQVLIWTNDDPFQPLILSAQLPLGDRAAWGDAPNQAPGGAAPILGSCNAAQRLQPYQP
jgi:hypothetical protein